MNDDYIINADDRILITGSNGFIGSKVVKTLLSYGFRNLRCFVRPTSNLDNIERIVGSFEKVNVEFVKGNLLSADDAKRAVKDVTLVFHLAAGMEKSFAGCYMNSVLTTRNLLASLSENKKFKRFLNVSSFAVYSNMNIRRGGMLSESCEIESKFMEKAEAYCYGKVKQDEMVMEFGRKYSIPYVIVRPGVPYGPGVKAAIHSRIGIDPFGIFFHLGGSNKIPFTYIDNCAEAIVLAGIKKGVDGEIFNIVDDDLPKSREFLRMYKKNVENFISVFIPYRLFYIFCYLWEKYSKWSKGQLPLAFNRRKCSGNWKGNRYSNVKLKRMLGWAPKVSFEEGVKRHFEFLRKKEDINA